jgi:RNA polymerase sigma-70 factor, ECF subfamily
MHAADTTTDADLLALMREGSEDAFTVLYRRHQGPVYRFALHMSGSGIVAEEVTQEVFLALIHKPGAYRPAQAPLAAWLIGIARKHVLRHLRSRTFEPEQCDAAADCDFAEAFERQESVNAVRRAVQALPEGYREAVVLCDLQEMKYDDAARALGCAIGTVRSRLHRARQLLGEKLRDRRTLKEAL